MLWNHGTHLFLKKSYKACSDFYKAALMYADDAAKPVVARQLALAHMATQNLNRSTMPFDCHEPRSTCLLDTAIEKFYGANEAIILLLTGL